MTRSRVGKGWAEVSASLTFPFRRGRGLQTFLDNYQPDGFLLPSPETPRQRAGFERCIGCGLCELALPRSGALRELAEAAWRTPEAWPGLPPDLEDLEDGDLVEAEALCPVDVPLRQLVAELRARAPGSATKKTARV